MLRGVYIIDADNTLWDTNTVFQEARQQMVHTLRQCGCGLEPQAALQVMRALDLQIALTLDDFEYDYSRLACALLLVDQGKPGSEAAALACASQPPTAEWQAAVRAGREFREYVNNHRPPLFAGVAETLHKLRAENNSLVLHSEGLAPRIQATLVAHAIDSLFDCVVLERKSQDSFRRARRAGERFYRSHTGRGPDQCVVVGDSPKRDIRFGNLIGATTVFKPGGWLGVEIPDEPLLTPHFIIEDFPEILRLRSESAVDLVARTFPASSILLKSPARAPGALSEVTFGVCSKEQANRG